MLCDDSDSSSQETDFSKKSNVKENTSENVSTTNVDDESKTASEERNANQNLLGSEKPNELQVSVDFSSSSSGNATSARRVFWPLRRRRLPSPIPSLDRPQSPPCRLPPKLRPLLDGSSGYASTPTLACPDPSPSTSSPSNCEESKPDKNESSTVYDATSVSETKTSENDDDVSRIEIDNQLSSGSDEEPSRPSSPCSTRRTTTTPLWWDSTVSMPPTLLGYNERCGFFPPSILDGDRTARRHFFDNGLTLRELRTIKPWSSFEAEDVGYKPTAHVAPNQLLRLENAPFWRKIHFPSVYLEHKNALLYAECQRARTLHRAYLDHFRFKSLHFNVVEEVATAYREAAHTLFEKNRHLYDFMKTMERITRRCGHPHTPCREFYWNKLREAKEYMLPAGKRLHYAEELMQSKMWDFEALQREVEGIERRIREMDVDVMTNRESYRRLLAYAGFEGPQAERDERIDTEWDRRRLSYYRFDTCLSWPAETNKGLSGSYNDSDKDDRYYDAHVTDEEGTKKLVEHGVDVDPQQEEPRPDDHIQYEERLELDG